VIAVRRSVQSGTPGAVLVRLAFAASVLVLLAAGLSGGLVRAGVPMPRAAWMPPAVTAHAFLMVCAFMGTLIGLERAVAVKSAPAFVGPFASAAAGLAMLAGASHAAAWTMVAASAAFVVVNANIVKRQRAAHTVLLLIAAVAWAAGCMLFAAVPASAAVVPLWFGFLVLTIAAERLEMTRLMRRRRGAAASFHAIVAAMLAGALLSAVDARAGGAIYGAALVALSVWLLVFDIARRTIRADGFTRYMAACLLAGYAWLFVAGAAWIATALGLPYRDAALHALALGFVFSMMLGHAPVILPALARVKVVFGAPYYLPLAMLHATLALRLVAGHGDVSAFAAGSAGNALAIAAFIATVAGSALAWRLQSSPSSNGHRRASPARH
jgi:hypothetical protein